MELPAKNVVITDTATLRLIEVERVNTGTRTMAKAARAMIHRLAAIESVHQPVPAASPDLVPAPNSP